MEERDHHATVAVVRPRDTCRKGDGKEIRTLMQIPRSARNGRRTSAEDTILSHFHVPSLRPM